MQDFRVIDLPERTTLDSSDYTMIDSAENGTNKYLLSRQAAETDAKIATAVGGVEAELDAAVEGIEEDITALQSDVETVETTLETKADVNGTYPDMAVGSVLGTNTVTDREPYFIRPSASIGDREFDTLVGGSLGWNQLVKTLTSENWASESGVTATFDNGVATISSSVTGNGLAHRTAIPILAHKYFVTMSVYGESRQIVAISGIPVNSYVAIDHTISNTNTWETASKIVDSELSGNMTLYALCRSGAYENVKIKDIMLIDITALFGSTIADYIYSLEQATAGAGVAWVRKYLPETYYAYCAPTLKHVTGVNAHVMRGFNQWDEVWELGGLTWVSGEPAAAQDRIRSKNFCKCLPNTTYYVKTTSNTFYGFWYDTDKNFIGYDVTSNANLLTTPSSAHYFKIVDVGETTDNNICVNISDPTRNGEYEPYVSHSYPIDSTWVGMGIPKLDSDNKLYFDGDTYASDGTVTERYGIRAYQSGDESLADAITDGTNTVYKLTTPTTSSASPYTSPQICDPDGTEEYVTTGLVPIGHETEYVENLADKLIDIPDLPTTAGTYSLKVTVSGGVPSYSWVSA